MKSAVGLLRVLIVIATASAVPHAARAGGGSFDSMDEEADKDAGPSYFGTVKDRGGDPIGDAKVTVTVKSYNSSLILRADDEGHFRVKGFDKSVDPEEVDFACSQDGYKFFARTKQPRGSEPDSPIEVICVLEKQ